MLSIRPPLLLCLPLNKILGEGCNGAHNILPGQTDRQTDRQTDKETETETETEIETETETETDRVVAACLCNANAGHVLWVQMFF